MNEEPINDILQAEHHFPSAIYFIDKMNFLEDVSIVANEALDAIKKENPQPNEIYPIYQTGQLYDENRMKFFCEYIAQTAWNILDAQGFNMSFLSTSLDEMWCQEHYKHSAHEEHIHAFGAQLVGFYFLETPEDCSRLVIHDPRPAKRQINLMEKNVVEATFASTMVNYIPRPGLLVFANSWLPHSFSRNASNKPMKFIHFTISVQRNTQSCAYTPENSPENAPEVI